ncbi:rhodanese-like domain-containing protein [Bacillus sp. PS06]|nr:rhodanese-like domain-containing protein [Bacillus sp. PS06]
MQTVINIILVSVLLYIIYDRFKPVKGLNQLSEQEIREKLKKPKDVVLIDVRQPYEYKSKHLPGAINIPVSKLKKKNEQIPEDKEVILYCQTGIRSKNAARLIKKNHKLSSLSHLKGGLYEWEGMVTSRNRKKDSSK